MRIIVSVLFVLFIGSLVTSCNSTRRMDTDYLLFQRGLDSLGAPQLKEPSIQPNDLLGIQVYSKSLNQEQAMLFNIPNTGVGGGSGGASTTGYLVDMSGNIEIPLIGSVKASGLTRAQLTHTLLEKLNRYVKDPGVIVRFLQFKINVLGEVKSPGTKSFQTDGVTIIDALGAAGDLTETAKRDDILVIREENSQRKAYHVDLRSGTAFQSPVFQLQQNDIVYVNATTNKLRQLKTNPNVQKDISLALTVASFAILIVNLINTFK
jgi:polysaccharide export outer membrane protein